VSFFGRVKVCFVQTVAALGKYLPSEMSEVILISNDFRITKYLALKEMSLQ
jgi:hypothetical protein